MPFPDLRHVLQPFARRLRVRRRSATTGAAAGALAWIALMALGLPQLAGFRGGHDFTLVAIALGALLAVTRLRVLVYGTTLLLALVVAVIAYTPVIEEPLHRLVRADGPPRNAPEAVFVLSAGVSTDSLLDQQGLDRLLYGVELVRSGIAPLLVITTFRDDQGGRSVTAREDQLHLARLIGLDSARVVIVDSVFSTRDEAVRGRRALESRRVRRIALVTSPAHSSRACRTFERAGFVVTCMPGRSRDVPFGHGALFRTDDRLQGFRLWLYEQVAWSVYRYRGWV